MTERAHDEKSGLYASLSRDVLGKFPREVFKEDENLSRLLSQSHQYKAVSCIYTDNPGSLFHLKLMMELITERLEKWNRTDDAVQLADDYNESAMAYIRDKSQEEAAMRAWIQSYETFGAIPSDPLDIKIRQECPAIHLAIIYALRNECQSGEDVLLPVIKAVEHKFGRDSTTSMV